MHEPRAEHIFGPSDEMIGKFLYRLETRISGTFVQEVREFLHPSRLVSKSAGSVTTIADNHHAGGFPDIVVRPTTTTKACRTLNGEKRKRGPVNKTGIDALQKLDREGIIVGTHSYRLRLKTLESSKITNEPSQLR